MSDEHGGDDHGGDGPGEGRRSVRAGSATEDLLVESTLRCLGRAGVAGATARTITADAGVNLAAITYHFGSKDQLVDRALVRAVRRLLDPVIALLESDPGALARALASVEERAAEGGAPCALYAEAAARAVRSDVVARGWAESHEALRAAIDGNPKGSLIVTAIVGTLTAASAGAAPEPGALVALATG
jgi:AcrR family transcriptional regulator